MLNGRRSPQVGTLACARDQKGVFSGTVSLDPKKRVGQYEVFESHVGGIVIVVAVLDVWIALRIRTYVQVAFCRGLQQAPSLLQPQKGLALGSAGTDP